MNTNMKILFLVLAIAGYLVAEVIILYRKKSLRFGRIIFPFMYGFAVEGIVLLIGITNSSLLIAFWRIMLFVSVALSIITISYGIVTSKFKKNWGYMKSGIFFATPLASCFVIMFIGTTAANIGISIPTLVMYTISFIVWGAISGTILAK